MSGIPVKLTGNAGRMNYEMQHEKTANDIVPERFQKTVAVEKASAVELRASVLACGECRRPAASTTDQCVVAKISPGVVGTGVESSAVRMVK
jgi:hypothetical protein